MVNVTTYFKRLFVRRLYQSSVDTGQTLLAVLEAIAWKRFDSIDNGKIVISTSGNGHSTTFEIPDTMSPTEAAELTEEILTRYEEAKAKLIADGTASPTDLQIKNEIMDKLNTVRRLVSDFTGLRTAVPDTV